MIDFANMKLGDVVTLPGTAWDDVMSAIYDQVQAYVESVGGTVQFQIDASAPQSIDGQTVRKFTLYRTR